MHKAKCFTAITFCKRRRCGRSACLSSDTSPVGLAIDMDRLFNDLPLLRQILTQVICHCVGSLVVLGWTSVAGASCGHYVARGEHSYTTPSSLQPAKLMRRELTRSVDNKSANWTTSADLDARVTRSTSENAAMWGTNRSPAAHPPCSGPNCQQGTPWLPVEPIPVSNSPFEMFAWFQTGEHVLVDAFSYPLAPGQATPIRELLARVERPPRF